MCNTDEEWLNSPLTEEEKAITKEIDDNKDNPDYGEEW